jgi:hypothetical protein
MRCVVLVDRALVPSWQHRCVDLLRTEHDVAVLERPAVAAREGVLARVLRALGGSALRTAPIVCGGTVSPGVDVVVDLRESAGPRDPALASRFGEWYFSDQFGRPLTQFPAAADIARGSATFTILLCRRQGAGKAAVIRRGRFKTLYTYARTLEIALGECARWPLERLKGGAAAGAAAPLLRETSARRVTFSILGFAYQQCKTLAIHVFNYFLTDAVWRVGVVHAPPAAFLNPDFAPPIRWIEREAAEFLADPFVLAAGGHAWLLTESLDRKSRNGYISCTEILPDWQTRERTTVLRSATHLSYPYAFAHRGEWYVVPESAAENRVSLYKIVDMPHGWERVATLLDGVPACDSTIFQYGGRWWLFCTLRSRDANLNLFAYHAEHLFGPWCEHAANPIKTDIGSARPAGAPFTFKGQLYRPAQDSSIAYGDRIVICRIVTLSPTEFAEETVASYGGSRGRIFRTGNHTLSHTGSTSVIDAKQTVFASPRVVMDRAVQSYRRLRLRFHGG